MVNITPFEDRKPESLIKRPGKPGCLPWIMDSYKSFNNRKRLRFLDISESTEDEKKIEGD